MGTTTLFRATPISKRFGEDEASPEHLVCCGTGRARILLHQRADRPCRRDPESSQIMKGLSEATSFTKRLIEESRPGTNLVRTPTSAPLVRASSEQIKEGSPALGVALESVWSHFRRQHTLRIHRI
jgi:hypothetical protein